MRRTLPLLVCAALALGGCASQDADEDSLTILASFYPLQFVAQRVGGDLVTVENLTPPAAEPHDLELSPAAVRALGHADLVVYLSEFQPAVDVAIAERRPTHALDAATTGALSDEPLDDAATSDNHDDHDHPSDGPDPHFWLDPTRLTPLAQAVAHELAQIDPAHAQVYRENAAALGRDLTALDTEFATALAPCAGATLVTSHEAFGYLTRRYDLHPVGIVGIDPDHEPSPARLREIRAIVHDENVSTLFVETLLSPKVAEVLAEDIGVDTAVLDPVENLATDATDYLGVMHSNLSALSGGLTCS